MISQVGFLNDAFVLFHRMSECEWKSMIADVLSAIPDDEQRNLLQATHQLTEFLIDTIDFPHKYIPLRSFPFDLKDMFYRFINNSFNIDSYDRYSREQLIKMDLVINPRRFSSWSALLNVKINQMEKMYSATDFTK